MMSLQEPYPLPVPPARPVRPRQVYSPIEHLHRDRQVADDARRGRFRYAGRTLDLGLPPDWRTGGLAHDEEWHIEWSKFYFGLDLAHAYAESGDPAYLDTWQDLVGSWIDQVAPDADVSEVTARRLMNWLYAWQGFDRATGRAALAPGLEQRLLDSAAAQLDHVADHLTPERNHRTLELFALLVVALGLPVLDPDGRRAAGAWELLQDNLLTDVWIDGVHRERSTHYHLIALRSFLGARINVARFGGEVPPAYDDRLRAALRFGLHLHRPDGQIPALSDSDSGSYLDLIGLAGDVLGDDELGYVASRGRTGTAPSERCADFPVAGYHVQRSGWGEREPYADERFLMMGCGPLGDGGHGHYDALSVEAYGLGHPLVVDPGRYTYAEGEPNWRHWFKGTAAHNTLTVDGLDQQPYRRGKPKGPQLGCRLLEQRSLDGFDLLYGEVTSPAYDAVHRRAVLFVARDYWLVLDTVRAEEEHDYALHWHLAADEEPAVVPHPADPLPTTRVTTSGVHVEVTGDPGPEVRVEPGWVSPSYGVRTPAPVVVARPPRTQAATLLTLLAPRRDGSSPRLWSADLDTGDLVVERADGTTDRILWHPDRPEAPHVTLAPRPPTGGDG